MVKPGKEINRQGVKRKQDLINPNRLKITGGVARGVKIDSPDVYLRPMMSKVRQAFFCTLQHLGVFQNQHLRVLDLYSGSGSVGLEALSRGALHCTFVDFAPECIETSLKNAEKCGFATEVRGVRARVEDVFRNPVKFKLTEPYQLVIMSPPYEEVVYNHLLNGICNSTLLEHNSILALEYPYEMGSLPFKWGKTFELIGLRNRRYGRTVLAIYVYRPVGDFDFREDEFTDLAITPGKPKAHKSREREDKGSDEESDDD